MKKISLIILIVLIVISASCSTGTVNPENTYAPGLTNEIVDVRPENQINNLSIVYPAYKWGDYYDISDWHTYIKEKFGIELTVNYKNISPNNILDIEKPGVLYLSYQRGYVYQFNTDVLDYSNEHIAYDLSDYYNYYGWDEYVDDLYKNALMIDNAIYAIPSVCNNYIIPRFYNKEKLNELNMSVPSTIDEFYYYLKRSKETYSGDQIYFPLCVNRPLLIQSNSDILRAYEVYFNTEFSTSVTYNPITDSFEDGVFSVNCQEAFEFIRNLLGEKLMAIYGMRYVFDESLGETKNIFHDKLDGFDKNFASEFNYVYSPTIDNFVSYLNSNDRLYESINGYFLEGLNHQFVCEVRSDLSFYMFPKNITNINETVEIFNRIFTNNEYFNDLFYGIDGKDYQIHNDTVISFEPEGGSFVGLKPISTSSYNRKAISYVPDSINVIENLESNMFFNQSIFNQIFTFTTQIEQSYFGINGANGIEDFFDLNIPLEDSIENYKSRFKKQGNFAIIEKMNERLGKVTSYKYN